MTRFGMVFRPQAPLDQLRPVARAADRAGLDELWLWEDCFGPSGFSTAASALAWTERLTVAIGLVPAPLRNVALTAMETATLTELHSRRFVLAVGHGVQDWMGQAGVRPASPLTLLREYFAALRALLAGEQVTTDGRYVTLTDVALDRAPIGPVPLWSGGTGPKTLALCGELADGVVATGGTTPEQLAALRTIVDEAATAAGRPRPRVAAFLMTVPGPDAAERYRREVEWWAPDEIGDFGAVGDATAIAAAARELVDAGADHVVFQPTADEPDLAGLAELIAGPVRAEFSSAAGETAHSSD